MPGIRGLQASARAAVAVDSPPTWAELETTQLDSAHQKEEPKLTLYRDTNGWCPFCERVWLSLREKGIPYDEVLINLYDKPKWYKEMVPTNLVPAVKFKDSGDVVWESEVIMRRLDEEYPDTRPMFGDEEKVFLANNITGRLMNASFGLAYRSQNMTQEEISEKRAGLAAALDELDRHLAKEGPFLAGDQLTAADAMAVPMLERYGVQMPFFAAELNLRDPSRWPALARWFDAMEALPSYGSRVAGDAYSWTAVAPVLMKLFGGQNGTLTGSAAARAEEAEQAAEELLAAARASSSTALAAASAEARAEAAAKLLSNHEAVVADAVLVEPKSQKELQRLPPAKAPVVDATLRSVAAALVAGVPPALPALDADGARVDPADVAQVCRYIAARLCAPRDMGAPAAAALRAAMSTLLVAAEEVEMAA